MDSTIHHSFEIFIEGFNPLFPRRCRQWKNGFVCAGLFNEILIQRLCFKGVNQQRTSFTKNISGSYFLRDSIAGLDPELKIFKTL